MAVKLGEMQAQLTRLDALGERLSSHGRRARREVRRATPGLGGAAPDDDAAAEPVARRVQREAARLLARSSRAATTCSGVLEAQLFEQAVKKKMMPTMLPVSGAVQRLELRPARRSVHRPDGDARRHRLSRRRRARRSRAAAGGVVVFAGFHPQYGYMVDIDHGNDLVTRYAHQSKLFVKDGDVVQRGRKIGEVGLHRPLDRAAPALRSALPRRGAEPRQVPVRRRSPSRPSRAAK